MAQSVGVNNTTRGSGTSITTTALNTQSSNSRYWICLESGSITSINGDTYSNTWSQYRHVSYAGFDTQVWTAAGSGGTSHQATCNFSSSGGRSVHFVEVIDGGGATDLNDTIDDWASPYTITSSAPAESEKLLAVICGDGASSTTTFSESVGWTKEEEEKDGTAYYPTSVWSITASSAQNASFTVTSGTYHTIVVFSSQAPAAAGVSGTIAVTLSSFTSSITGQRGHQGTIAQTLSSFTSSIAGAKTVLGTISQTLASFTSAITGTKTIIGTLAQTLADFTSSLAGGVGKIGTIARTLGAFLSEILGDGFITMGSWKDRLIGNRYRHASHYVTTGRRRNRNNG
jgi:hypothetical protein